MIDSLNYVNGSIMPRYSMIVQFFKRRNLTQMLNSTRSTNNQFILLVVSRKRRNWLSKILIKIRHTLIN